MYSAGVGRTGTFITIDTMMERLQEKDDLNIYEFVTDMRKRRTFMVQTLVSNTVSSALDVVSISLCTHYTFPTPDLLKSAFSVLNVTV